MALVWQPFGCAATGGSEAWWRGSPLRAALLCFQAMECTLRLAMECTTVRPFCARCEAAGGAPPICFLVCVRGAPLCMRVLQVVHGLWRQRGSFKRRLAKPATSSKNARYASRFDPYSFCNKETLFKRLLWPYQAIKAKARRCRPLQASIQQYHQKHLLRGRSPTVDKTEPETPSRRAVVRRFEPSDCYSISAAHGC